MARIMTVTFEVPLKDGYFAEAEMAASCKTIVETAESALKEIAAGAKMSVVVAEPKKARKPREAKLAPAPHPAANQKPAKAA